ncbi:unnamed protein product [Adineta steineri]|uniref:G-protein coupled receptors family 1 profile domain-containing protein n=1 Tax=Adineta steineri TaxID=433720 RepID=A0A818LA15_9BILA|nr:unnamed protein product [Adineta steineri]CAF3569454.1 unnamed protein product [Adineta steineri]
MTSPTLTAIQTQLNFYVNPTVAILGGIGNMFVTIIFTRQHQNACSLYLVIAAIFNTFYLGFNRVLQYFPFYYLDGTVRAFFLCKLRGYLPTVLGQVAKTMIVFACIDRYMITSNRATFRGLSTSKRAKYLIAFSVIFWALVSSHIAIEQTILNGQCSQFGTYATIYSIFTIIAIGSIPPIMMGICGYLTYRNMRHLRVRIQPTVNNINEGHVHIRQRDRDLLIIVIYEIFIYVLTASLYPLILVETIITNNTIARKSALHSQVESFLLFLSFLLLSVNSAAACYIYLVLSKSFRRDFKQIFIYIYRKLTRQTEVVTVHGPTGTIKRNTQV